MNFSKMIQAPNLYNDSSPTCTPGEYYWYNDPDLGRQVFVYSKMTGGASTAHYLYKKVADVTGFTIDAVGPNPTKELRDADAGLTAGLYSGALAYIYTDGANAAPEGEIKRIKTNESGIKTLETELSAAVAVGDVAHILNNNNLAEAASSETDRNDFVGFAAAAITEDYWGMFQVFGLCPMKGSGTKGGGLIHDTGNAGKVKSSSGETNSENIIGLCRAVTSGSGDVLGFVDLISWLGMDLLSTAS